MAATARDTAGTGTLRVPWQPRTWDWITDLRHEHARQEAKQHNRRAARRLYALGTLLTLTAILFAAIPFARQSTGDTTLQQAAGQAQSTMAGFPQSSRDTLIQQAVQYNRQLADSGQPAIGGTSDPLSGDTTVDWSGKQYAGYLTTLDLDGSGLMGTLEIPSIGLSLPIRHGADEQSLGDGVGHLPGSSLPVGGADTHAVLTGHSGMSGMTLFTRIDELNPGSMIYIDTVGGRIAYRVTGSRISQPDDMTGLRIEKGRDLLTLVTCTGQGNSLRLLIDAERDTTHDHDTLKDTTPVQSSTPRPLGTILAAGIVMVPALAVTASVQARRRDRQAAGARHARWA